MLASNELLSAFSRHELTDATNSFLIVTNVQSANQGAYSLLVTNSFGSVVSSNAVLTVQPFLFSTDSTSLQLTPQGFHLQLTGSAGLATVVVYASTNLMDWTPIFTNAPGAGPLDFLDFDATNALQRFYRAEER